jgi:hypothetical protein
VPSCHPSVPGGTPSRSSPPLRSGCRCAAALTGLHRPVALPGREPGGTRRASQEAHTADPARDLSFLAARTDTRRA